jgi:hypothetical protein
MAVSEKDRKLMIERLTHSIRQRRGPKSQASSQGLEQKRLDQKTAKYSP